MCSVLNSGSPLSILILMSNFLDVNGSLVASLELLGSMATHSHTKSGLSQRMVDGRRVGSLLEMLFAHAR